MAAKTKDIVDWVSDKSGGGKKGLILKICSSSTNKKCIEKIATNYLSMAREGRGLPEHDQNLEGPDDLQGYANFEGTFSRYPEGAAFTETHKWFFYSVFDILGLRLKFTEENFEKFKAFSMKELRDELPESVAFAIEGNWVSFPHTSIYLRSDFLDPIQNYDDWKISQVIDQKQMYQSKVAARRWSEVIGSNTHFHKIPKTQRDCADQLSALMRSEFLAEEAQRMPFERVVFLGAAGCDKEENVISGLDRMPDNKKRFSVWFVDTSGQMLTMSNENILALDDQLQDSLKYVLYLQSKFESLPRHPAWFRRFPADRTLYLILGGTFGNNSEKEFLSAMASIMAPDDLLIINADTFEEGSLARFRSEKEKEYRANPSIEALVARPLVEELVPPRNAKDDVLDRCVVRTVSYGEQGSDCEVPESFSVQYFWESGEIDDNIQIRLSTSKKYLESELLSFLDTQGFALVIDRGVDGQEKLPFVCQLKREPQPDDQ